MEPGSPIEIVVKPNGPIIISGRVELRRPDGTIFYSGAMAKLCRCGQSAIKPFCDGTHKRIGFVGEGERPGPQG